MRRGITLLELLLAMAMLGILIGAVTRAYVSTLGYEQHFRESRLAGDRYREFEDKLGDVILHAYLSADANDVTTYFIGGDPSAEATSGPAQSITFTSVGSRVPSMIADSTSDFESLNNSFGPQGGVAEITLSTTALAATGNQSGLFIREQRPADGDPTQGGFESVLNSDVDSIEFQFFDGANWLDAWDTRTGQRRLPAAVQVRYRLTNDDNERTFVVRIPLSDVTPTNPLQQETSG